MDEAINALCPPKENPPDPASNDLGELRAKLEALSERVDFMEGELALLLGRENRSGFLSWILGKR